MTARPLAPRLLHPTLEADAEGESQWLYGRSELSEFIGQKDWAESPLGPLGCWPQQLQTVVNIMLGSSHAMFVVWGEARTLLYNEPYADIIGDKHPEALGRPMFDVCSEMKPDLKPFIERAFEGEPTHATDIEVQLHRPGGPNERQFDLSCTPVRDDGGRVLGVLCTCVETTSRKRAEWQSEAARDLAEKTLETIREPMLILHDDLRVKSANRVFYRTFRTRPDETVGRLIYELGNNQWDIPELRELLECIVPHKETITDFEVEHEFEHIGRRTMLLNAQRIDHLQLILLAIEDITDRRRAEQELKESERKFHLMADNAPVMIWVTDADGSPSFMSRGWHDFTGRSPEQETGSGWLDAVHPEDREHAESTFAVANANHEPFRVECRIQQAEGDYAWTINAASPRFDETGRFLGFVGSIMDISDRKHDEQRMRMIMAELNHRVKNTLAVVSSIAEQTWRHAEHSRQFRNAFFERLQSMSKAHGLLTRMKWEGARIGELLHIELEHRVEEDWQLTLDGPPIVLEPDAALALHLMFHELATNASKYGALSSSNGRITVTWQCRPSEDNCQEITIHWEESGGPEVEPPKRRGFGTKVLQHTASYELDGAAELDYKPDGLRCSIRFPWTAGATVEREEGAHFND